MPNIHALPRVLNDEKRQMKYANPPNDSLHFPSLQSLDSSTSYGGKVSLVSTDLDVSISKIRQIDTIEPRV